MEHLNLIIPAEPLAEKVADKKYEVQLSDRLRSLRKAAGKTLKEISEVLGVSLSTYAGYEAAPSTNNHRVPSLDKIMKLANYFGVSVDYLIGNSDIRYVYKQASVWDALAAAPLKPFEREMAIDVLNRAVSAV